MFRTIVFVCFYICINIYHVYSQEDFLVLCKTGSYSEIKNRISKGVDINYKNEYGYSPIIVASSFNNDEKVIDLLIKSGASIDCVPIGWSCYLIKEYFENKEKFYEAEKLSDKIEAYLTREYISSPLWFSARYNINEKVSEQLILSGSQINILLLENETPLIASFANPNISVYKIFLKYGADVNLGEKYGSGALQAVSSQFTARFPLTVFQDLIEHGARLYLTDSGRQHSILISASSEQTPEVLEYLISCGADVFDTTSGNSTPMHLAAMDNNYPEVMDVLLKHGLDINAINDYGDTPLIIACRYNSDEMIYKCLELGASPYISDKDGNLPLEIARRRFPSYAFIRRIGEIFLERDK